MVADQELKIKFTADTADFKRGQKDAERALIDTTRALREQIEQLKKEIDELKKSSTATTQEVRVREQQVKVIKLQVRDNRELLSILKEQRTATNSVVQGLKNFDSYIQKDNAHAKELINTLNKLNTSIDATAQKAKESTKETVRGATELEKTSVGLLGAFTGLKGFFAAGLVGFGAKEALDAANAYNVLQARIKFLTKETGNYLEVSRGLERIANETGSQLSSNVDVFQGIARGAREIGATDGDIIQVVDTIQKLGAVANSTGKSFDAALTQLSQGLGSGTLQGQELASVLEQAQPIAQAVADKLGVGVGQLKKMAEQGKITSQVVFEALLEKTEEANKAYQELGTNTERSQQRAINAFQKTLASIDGLVKITDLWAKSLDNVVKLLNRVSDGLDQLPNSGGPDAINFEDTRTYKVGEVIPGRFQRDNYAPTRNGLTQADINGFASSFNVLNPFGLKAQPGRVFKQPAAKAQSASDLKKRDTAALRGIGLQSDLAASQAEYQANVQLEAQRRNEIAQLGTTVKLKQNLLAIAEKELGQLQAAKLLNNESEEARKQQITAKTVEIQKLRVDLLKSENDLIDKQKQIEKEKFVNNTNLLERQINLAGDRAIFRREGNPVGQAESEQVRQEQLLKKEQILVAGLKLRAQTQEDYNEILEKEESIKERILEVDKAKLAVFKARQAQQNTIRQQQFDAGNQAFDDRQARIGIANNAQLGDFNRKLDRNAFNLSVTRDYVEEQYQRREKSARAYFSQLAQLTNQQADLEVKRLEGIKATRQAELNLIIEKVKRNGTSVQLEQESAQVREELKNTDQQILEIRDKQAVQLGQLDRQARFTQSQDNLNRFTQITGLLSQAGGPVGGIASILGATAVGFATGGPFGAAIGAAGSIASNPGGIFGKSAAVDFGLLGPLGFLFGGSRRRRKIAQKNAESQKSTKKLVERVVNPLQKNPRDFITGSNSQDLGDLTARLAQANDFSDLDAAFNRLAKKKTSGETARDIRKAGLQQIEDLKQARRDQQKQLEALIKQREADIKSFVGNIQDQNRTIEQGLALGNAKTTERIVLEQQQLLDNLRRDTQRALDQFRDSQEAQTEILRNEALKRQQIEQGLRDEYKASAQQLEDLLKQRDEISNRNVFQRATSTEQQKANDIAALDKEIAAQFAAIKQYQQLGISTPDLANIGRLTGAAGNITNAQLNVVINGATDTEEVRQQVERALNDFAYKLGASAA